MISWTATFIIMYTGWLCPASALVWSAFSIILYYSRCAYSISDKHFRPELFIGSTLFWRVFCVFMFEFFCLFFFPCAIVFNSIYWICISFHFVFSIYNNRKTFLTLFSRSLLLSQMIIGYWSMVFELDISVLTILWTKWLMLQKLSRTVRTLTGISYVLLFWVQTKRPHRR